MIKTQNRVWKNVSFEVLVIIKSYQQKVIILILISILIDYNNANIMLKLFNIYILRINYTHFTINTITISISFK